MNCSTGDYFLWNDEAINHWQECPAPGRIINMNRIGAALCGEVSGPEIQSLFVFCANPMISAPNTARVQQGLQREDLFTVVHDLFMTDTARQADIILPATSQLEQVDLHRGYGHTVLGYNHAAIAPLGESKSNWEVMQLLSQAMGFNEPWLSETADEVIDGILSATREDNPRLAEVSLQSLRENPFVEFADGVDTEFFRSNNPEGSPERVRKLGRIPLGRFGNATDIAKTVAFFLSDDASYITGQTLFVDGSSSLASSALF
jgi:anaerobic selenocysteine-containing dehydrogenase